MNSPALQHPKTARAYSADRGAAGKGRVKFLRAKIPRNPLKSLDSDEGIQGNPSFSNSQNPWFSPSTGPFQENPNGRLIARPF
jgi:hypothetical protein